MKLLIVTVALFLVPTGVTLGQIARTEHILGLEEDSSSPAATLSDVEWLAGAWQGEAFGGTFEEVWTNPAYGSMVGLFKLINDGEPSIYEIQLLVEEGGTLIWKVKHFGSDFGAWEEKDHFESFPLVKVEPNTVYFDGLTLVREAEGLTVYLLVSSSGQYREETLIYKPMTLGPD